MEFKIFVDLVKARFDAMSKQPLFKVDVDKQELYDMYLDSFPEGTNVVYKERREYDCNVCKNFIRDVGGAVIIKNNKIETIWDIEAPGYYNDVCKAMSAFVKSAKIKNHLKTETKNIGTAQTFQEDVDNVQVWNHFHCTVPAECVNLTPSQMSKIDGMVHVFERGMREISLDTAEIVLDLISSNSVYRGAEHKKAVEGFIKLKKQYTKLPADEKDGFLWSKYKERGAHLNGDVIGTLLIDIEKGKDLMEAVVAFGKKMDPTNYKRPKSIYSKKQAEEALAFLKEEGLEHALYRRFATASDLSVNNVLFVDRSVAPVMKDSLEEMLMEGAKTSKKDYSKVEEVSIENFVENILPNATSLEVLPANNHSGNFMSLIAPKFDDVPNIFKWDNNFTWNYNGNITDAMKERVKAAGGDVTGVLRFSIQWNEAGNEPGNDLDAHCMGPTGHIYFSAKQDGCTGRLDVDIRHPGKKVAVENITWQDIRKMRDGTYKFSVVNYSGKNSDGFTAQIEFDGTIYSYTYNYPLSGTTSVAEVTLKNGKFSIKHNLESSETSKDVWGVKTNEFQKVSMVTISPNHWDDQEIGNKHYFFILDKCKTDEEPRGFYNEFLNSSFDKYRKVFEMLGNKTKCELTDDQLSGLGFSTTQRDELIVKVGGTFNRMVKIKF